MDFNTLFSISNMLVLPFWLIMIAPWRWAWAVRIIRSPAIAVPPALVYAAVIVPILAAAGPGLVSAFGSLPGVIGLLSTPAGALVGWVHFLAFDLFVGRWAYLDALERGVSPWLMAPVLLLIFMFGPLGLLLYLAVRLLTKPK